MLLIITGPPASGKTTIARAMQRSTGARIYDEMPADKPDDFPSEGFVIITTNSHLLPAWISDTHFGVLKTANMETYPSIQSILETLPLPASSGPQFTICQNRHYPKDDTNRFVVRVMKKNFTGNDVAQLLLNASAYYQKRTNK